MKTELVQLGQQVQFRLADIHLPAIEEVLNRMTEDTELHGTVTLLSDHGEQNSAYAIIEVKGILMPIIVPVSALESFPGIQRLASAKTW
ncbi:MAG TPA: hypothetical protein VM008_01025 [Phycisphaerae bacterium]|nr:hypothetical protein [Phycisphaerae bacterium]